VAGLIGAADDQEIVFTSGGTESNHAAIRSAIITSGKKHIITSAVEHSSVKRLCSQLQKEGFRVTEIGVDPDGRLKINDLQNALIEDTAIVSLMMANNETGVLFPVEEIGRLIRDRGILFHVDGVQAAGKVPVDLKKSAIDFFSVSAHKIYGPKGVGALYVRKGIPFHPLISGGGQQRGRRAGTENVPGIAGFGSACRIILMDMEKETARLQALRDSFEKEVSAALDGVTIHGLNAPRLANVSSLRFQQITAETLIARLEQKGICVSTGSACMSGSSEPSHVLMAMGVSPEEALSAVRFSFGRFTQPEDIQILISELAAVIRSKSMAGIL
jgi:cysteine desulfurase